MRKEAIFSQKNPKESVLSFKVDQSMGIKVEGWF